MRSMRVGDLGFLYHSQCSEPGVVAIVQVVREAYVDHTQFDKENDEGYDPHASQEAPRWFMVDVRLERRLERVVSLRELKRQGHVGGKLDGMWLFRLSRLSVQPVSAPHFAFIEHLATTNTEERGNEV